MDGSSCLYYSTILLLFVQYLVRSMDYAGRDQDVFLCVGSAANETTGFVLSCDRFSQCLLRVQDPWWDELARTVAIPDWHALADNCTDVENEIMKIEVLNDTLFSFLNGFYRPLSSQIRALELEDIHLDRLPPDFFCGLPSLSRIFAVWRFFTGPSKEFPLISKNCIGLSHRCTSSIQRLDVRDCHQDIVGNHWFGAFSNLRTLHLNYWVKGFQEDAFESLKELRELDLFQNTLTELPKSLFEPLTNLVSMRLSSNKLVQDVLPLVQCLPKFRKLDLTHNQIADIGKQTKIVCASSLKELKLGFNLLTSLRWNMFQFLGNLTFLELNDNIIDNIEEKAFDPLVQIVEIELEDNRLRSVPDGLLTKNTQIQRLDVGRNQLPSIPGLNSSSLEVLDVSYNNISHISESDKKHLCELMNLNRLNLASNQIQNIVPSAFSCNSRLNRIDLSWNQITSIKGVFRDSSVQFLKLNSNKLKSLSFEDLPDGLLDVDLSGNEIKEIISNHNVLNRSMALQILKLGNNSLRNWTSVVLPPNITELILTGNRMAHFSIAKDAESGNYILPRTLQHIDLSWNHFTVLCPLVLYHFHSNTIGMKINIGDNRLMCPCEMNVIHNQMQKYFSNHDIQTPLPNKHQLCLDTFGNGTNHSTITTANLQQRIQVLTCDKMSDLTCQCNTYRSYNSECDLPCPQSCTCYINHNFTSYVLNCRDQKLFKIPPMPQILNISLVLDFSANHLESLNETDWTPYPLATELYLQNNNLTSIEPNAFNHLLMLEILNLESNLLEELPEGVLVRLTKLRELNLADNHFSHLPGDLLVMRLPPPQNFIKTRPSPLSALSYMKLGNNPWSCDCDHIEAFRQWLQRFSILVKDSNRMNCSFEEDPTTSFPIMSFNSSYCYKNYLFFTDRTTPIWASVMSFMIFLAAIFVMILVYRQEVQVILYYHTGWRLGRRDPNTDVDKLFDAFVAYSSQDAEFVADQLVPGLEGIESPYKLCIHDRDFLAGADILDTIQVAILHSRRSIVVLSSNFVKSEWCLLEFKMAHRQMLMDSDNRLIVIILDDIPEVFQSEMKLYMKTNTFLKWTDRLFWQKLYYALPDR